MKAEKPVKLRVEMTGEMFAAIVARVALGERVSEICAEPHMPSATSFYAYTRTSRDALSAYEAAKCARAELHRDKIAEINEKLEKGLLDPQSAREISNNLKWLAGKDAPHLFGEKASLEVTGKDGKDFIPEYPTDHLELARFMGLILDKGRRQQLEANANQGLPALPNGGAK